MCISLSLCVCVCVCVCVCLESGLLQIRIGEALASFKQHKGGVQRHVCVCVCAVCVCVRMCVCVYVCMYRVSSATFIRSLTHTLIF